MSRDTDTIMELRTALEVEKERGSRLRYEYRLLSLNTLQ
jgi:hypothetical protein